MTSIRSGVRWLQQYTIESPVVFWAIAVIVIGYIVFMMARKRRGERTGADEREIL
jgi:hypothetical protein